MVSYFLTGDDNLCSRGSVYTNPKEMSLFLPLGRHVDFYYPPHKRSRISAPFVFSEELFQQKQTSIEDLPDECLFEVFRRLPGGQERSSCACVSKRWLMLLSSICGDEICPTEVAQSLAPEESPASVEAVNALKSNEKDAAVVEKVEPLVEDPEVDSCGYLSRCLEGKKATDVRLASIAIGTASRGGLGKLSIRGSNSSRGVTDVGLKAIARGCSSLKALSLWNVSTIGDAGLIEIASRCHMLEKLDICQCPEISDKALLAVANNCPNLTTLAIESCGKIGNESLQSIGRSCPNLKSFSIKNCPLIEDQGIASLVSSTSYSLTKMNVQALNIGDMSLAVIGHYGKSLTDLSLTGLQNVTEKGFWVMGNGQGLQKLSSFVVTSCRGVTDLGLGAVAKGCPNLKHFCLRKCAFLSDNGLVSFAKVAASLESLQLEECHRITQFGFFGLLTNCGEKLKALSLTNCLGIKDSIFGFNVMPVCNSLRTLCIRNCAGFGNASLEMLGKICLQLQHLDVSGLNGITDEGMLPLIQYNEAGLKKVNLCNCTNMTDKAVSAIARMHGGTLELLNLDGCRNITDASLVAIADNCFVLSELDISKCAISDSGIAALACRGHLNLRTLSVSSPLVSDRCLPFLAKLGQTLVGLNIQHCCGISSNMVDQLVEHLWRCDILS